MDVITSSHPRGEAGIRRSLDLVRQGAVEDRGDPKVREWAFQVLQAGGNPQDASGKAQLLLTGMREHFHYISDPVDLEFIASTRMTLCLEGAELCFRGGDCDDATRAMVALLLIVGINAAVVHQEFEDSDHVLAGFETDDGRWLRVDPCYLPRSANSTAILWRKSGPTRCLGTSCARERIVRWACNCRPTA